MNDLAEKVRLAHVRALKAQHAQLPPTERAVAAIANWAAQKWAALSFADVTILDMRRRLSSLRRHPLYERYLELVGVVVILTCTAAVAVNTREQMMWLCAVFFAGVTGLAGLAIKWRNDQIRREYRQSHGLCMKCGYDLRETADRCRECGTMPKFQFTTRPATERGVKD